MKRVFYFLICFLLQQSANAQLFLRSSEDSSAIVNAVVRQGELGIAYYSDHTGKVKIPDLKNGFIFISITHPGFDTLSLLVKNQQIIYLKTRISSFGQVIYTGSLSEKKANKDLLGSVRIINASDIRNSGSQNLGDILKYQPNITLTNDVVLGTSISINGMSGQNVKLLKNGAAISGAMNGSIDVSQINVTNIAQIEIIEGPMSLLYGSNALAGTINLINKLPAKKTQFTSRLHTESSGVYNLSAGMSKMIKKNYLSLHFGRNFFDGWTPGHRLFYHLVNREANWERNTLWKPRQQFLGDFSLMIPINTRTEIKINSDYLNETILNKGLPLQPYSESAFDDYYMTLRNINSAEINIRNNKVKHNLLLSYSYYNRIKNSYFKDLTKTGQGVLSAPESQDTTSIHTSQVRYIANAKIRKLSLNWGLDANQEYFIGQKVLKNRQSISNVSFVGILSYSFQNKHDFKVGVRQTLHSLNTIPLIPSFSSKIRINKSINLKLSAAKGYRTPGVKELYLYFVDINHNIKGNPNLKSESSVNYNVVLTHQKNLSKNALFNCQINAYYNTFKNLITLAAINTTEYTYVNIGKSSSKGLNFEIKYENKHIALLSQNAVISSSNNQLNNPIPPYLTTINTFFRGSYKFLKNKNLSFNTMVNYFGKSPSLAYINNEPVLMHTPDYWMIDLTVNLHMIFKRNDVNLTAGIKNLDNITNLSSGLNNTSAHQVSTGQRIISTGRTFFFSLEYSL